MGRFQSTSVSFVSKTPSIQSNNQIIPTTHPQLLPSTSNVLFANNFRNPIKQNRNGSNIFLISYSIFVTLGALILVGINVYRMMTVINMTTTTTTTTTSTTTTSIAYPSECYSYTSINDSTRLITYAYGPLSDNTWLTATPTWIRFIDPGGTTLVTWSPGGYNCNAAYTGWYVSSLPSPGSTVSGIVCYAFITTICPYFNTISVTNCGSFYVYALVNPPIGTARYCTI